MKYSFFSDTSGPVGLCMTAVSGSSADSAPASSWVTYSPFWRAISRLLAKHANNNISKMAASRPPTIALVEVLGKKGRLSVAIFGGGRVSKISKNLNAKALAIDYDFIVQHLTWWMCWWFDSASVLVYVCTRWIGLNITATALLVQSTQREVIIERHP